MRRLFVLIVLLCCCIPAAWARTPLDSLADAERAFAAAGARDGVQKAFLAHFADDAIVLRPFATSALAWHRAHPDKPGRLLWAPQFLAVSSAGDFGLSSGPWHFEGVRDGKPVSAYGHFLSIWRHDAEHGWRVVLDHGIGHGPPATAVDETPLVALDTAARPAGHARAAARERSLAAADDGLRERLARGAPGAYAAVARPDTLWLREGALPSRGVEPPSTEGKACGCGPRVRLVLAESGDFGYSIGGGAGAPDKGVDVRVWQTDAASDRWTLLADLSAAAQ